MVSPYTFVPEQRLVDQYVPLPFEEMYKAGAAKQQGFDEAKNEVSKLASMMKDVNARPGHEQYRQDLEDKYHNQLKQVQDKLFNKGDYRGAQYDMQNIANDWVSDPTRKELETSYQNYGLYQKERISQGNDYADYKDESRSWQPGQDGKINPYRFNGMGKRTDWEKAFGDYMGTFKDSGYTGKTVKVNADGTIDKTESGWEGTKQGTIWSAAEAKQPEVKNTVFGQDFTALYKSKYPHATDAQIDQAMTVAMYNTKIGDIHMKTTSGYDIGFTPDYNDIKKKSKINPWTTVNTNVDPKSIPDETWNKYLPDQLKGSMIFKDGKLTLDNRNPETGTQSSTVVKIGGIEYNINALPKGYKYFHDPLGDIQDEVYKTDDKGNHIDSHTVYTNYNSYEPSGEEKGVRSTKILSYMKDVGLYNPKLTPEQNFTQGMSTLNNMLTNGSKNSGYIPMFDATTANMFEDTYMPKTKDGKLIDPGRVANWEVSDINKDNATELDNKKIGILTNSKVIGPDVSKGSDYMIVQSYDPNTMKTKNYSVKTNNITIQNKFNDLSQFGKDVNGYLMNRQELDLSKDKVNVQTGTNKDGTPITKEQTVDEYYDIKGTKDLLNKKGANYKLSSKMDSKDGEHALAFSTLLPDGTYNTVVKYFDPHLQDWKITSLYEYTASKYQEGLSPIAPSFNDKNNKVQRKYYNK